MAFTPFNWDSNMASETNNVSLRPYGVSNGSLLGSYSVAQLSGAIAATPTALDVHARIRWAPSDPSTVCVLSRIRVGWHVISAITTAVRMSYQASIVRGFTSDFTTAITNISMAAQPQTNQMRRSMSPSLMGSAGPGICTTAPLTVMTYTLDAAPFAITNWPVLTATNSTGTAVALPAGAAGAMQTLYEWNGVGHPVTLGNLEGVVIQLTHTGHATGTVSLATQWEWSEYTTF